MDASIIPIESSTTKAIKKKFSRKKYSSKPRGYLFPIITNIKVAKEYESFVKSNPSSLPSSHAFNVINKLWPKINTAQTSKDKEADRQMSLFKLFNENSDVRQFLKDPLNNPLNVMLTGKKNLYYFFTKIMFFTNLTSFNTDIGTINIPDIKKQLGKDLHRTDIYINSVIMSRTEIEQFALEQKFDEEVDYFNNKLISIADKQQTKISLNTINLIDMSCIQQIISFTSDSILKVFSEYSILQMGGKKKINIVINSIEQYVEFFIESKLISMDPELISMKVDNSDYPPVWGTYDGTFRMNINDLSYYFKIDIKTLVEKQLPQLDNTIEPQNSTIPKYQNKMSNIRTGAINYVKENPTQVATGVGAAAVLGSSVGALFLAGILGGKTKKYSHKKGKNRKTVRKNKRYKTKQTYK